MAELGGEAGGVHATLFDAGHILGSASVLLEGAGTTVLLSGDLGRVGTPSVACGAIDDRYTTTSRREERLFSRDCAEYQVVLPGGRPLVGLLNHFKSKGYGAQDESTERRRRQARRARDLVSRHDLQRDLVFVAGDLNDTPDSESLRDLLETPSLHDVLDALPPGAPRWTYRGGRDQIDYLLVSDALRQRLVDVGIERRGIWSRDGATGRVPMFPEVTDESTQASDHAAVWAEFDL